MKKNITVMLLILFASFGAQSENIVFQPGMTADLGESFDPFAPFDVGSLGECFDVTYKEKPPIAQESYSEGFVSSFSEFSKKTGLSLSASGSTNFGLAKVSAAADYKEQREIFNDNKSIVYIVSGVRSYNSQRVKRVKLTDEGKAYLSEANEEKDSQLFYRPCGRGLITSVVKETNISVAYVFTASNSKYVEEISSAVSLAVSSSKGKANAAVNLTSSVKQVDSTATVSTYIFQSGTIDNTPSLKSLIGLEPADILSVRQSLKEAIKAISWETSQIKSFNVDKISRHFDIEKDPTFKYIASLFSNLDIAKTNAEKLVARYIQIEDVLAADGLAGFSIKPASKTALQAERTSIEKRLNDLSNKTRLCFDNFEEDCFIRAIDIDTTMLKHLNINFGQFNKWKAQASGSYANIQEQIHKKANYWPEFSIYNINYINRFEFVRDSGTVLKALDQEKLKSLISNSVLELSDVDLQTSAQAYCSSVKWGEICGPAAENLKNHKNELKQAFSSTSFRGVIVDIEGNRIELPVPRISEQNYN
ncbi:hypothetical protein [Aliiglaciecola sp. M165]|uniref:hypothetical protein n=1 Tax=Aliiglaciecola sp. M165 TaxID=2593649 RepID=UPI00117E20AB|nr:hypothetical protein [Aliiglaciecola sp. M165]TRY29802.1 hypothetical protein FM019_16660 [Aliiglaciecola sp. M165]